MMTITRREYHKHSRIALAAQQILLCLTMNRIKIGEVDTVFDLVKDDIGEISVSRDVAPLMEWQKSDILGLIKESFDKPYNMRTFSGAEIIASAPKAQNSETPSEKSALENSGHDDVPKK